MPQLPGGEGQASMESEVPEEAIERLAHLEQLVVQLKELIRDKDTHLVQKDTELANKDAQLKVKNPVFVCYQHIFLQRYVCLLTTAFLSQYPQNEKEEANTRFTKLKLQAKAKMASLNKQINDLKGSGGGTVSLRLRIKNASR